MSALHPFVSVIIPSYNHARFLDERIYSILNQTYKNFELIILDDKSTDDSLNIINKYKSNPYISHIILNDKNTGSPFKQWDKGIKLAKGDLIWIAESDDVCDLNFLEELLKTYNRTEVVLIFCHSQMMNAEGVLMENIFQKRLDYDFELKGDFFIKKFLVQSNIIQNASSVLFSRKAALCLNNDYLCLKGAGDWLFWIEIARQGDVLYVNKALNYYRWHGKNVTSKNIGNGKDMVEVKLIYDYLRKNKFITVKEYNSIRRSKLYAIYESDSLDYSLKRMLFRTWGVDVAFYIYVLKVKIFNLLYKFKVKK